MTDPIDPGGVQARVNEMHETLAKVNQSLGLPVRSRGGESVPTDPIVAFLNARLDDDQRIAEASPTSSWRLDPEWAGAVEIEWEDRHTWLAAGEGTAPHIARHDPRRVLADVEAKRAILAAHPLVAPDECDTCDSGAMHYDRQREAWPCPTVRALASVYRDHPDFDPSWAS